MIDTSEEGRTIDSVERAIDILATVAQRDGAGITDLANELDLAKSSVHLQVSTLEAAGYLVRTEDDEFVVGLRALLPGGQARRHTQLFTYGKETIDRIAEQNQVCSQLVEAQHFHAYVVYQSDRSEEGITQIGLGTNLDLQRSAAGKAILAKLPASRRATFFESGVFETADSAQSRSVEDLRGELETVREQNIAFDRGEQWPELACVASPIVANDRPIGAVSISVPESTPDSVLRGELVKLVDKAARAVEMKMSYDEWL